MGHGLVSAIACCLHAQRELVVVAGSWGACSDQSHLNWEAKPEAAQHWLSPVPSSQGFRTSLVTN